jgi:LAS superfamily LD-carboxypeptidase LdcB
MKENETHSVYLGMLQPYVRDQANEPVAARLLAEYGSIFVASGGASPPDRIIFQDEIDVQRFQRSVNIGSVQFGETTIELQSAAAEALARAVGSAERSGLSIRPRSADSGRRSYHDTVELWLSRVEPALTHWLAANRLSFIETERIRKLSPFEQVKVIFELEETGLYFAKDLSKSIIYSVAPPGASQHLSMLAFDVAEYSDERVRNILAEHFWYQTVASDLPHFTYLGIPESDLTNFGLKPLTIEPFVFWRPDL